MPAECFVSFRLLRLIIMDCADFLDHQLGSMAILTLLRISGIFLLLLTAYLGDLEQKVILGIGLFESC